MEIVTWLILGGLAGWISSIILGTDAEQGSLTYILLGLIGAVLGGMIVNFLITPHDTGPTLSSIFVAVLGATGLILIARYVYR